MPASEQRVSRRSVVVGGLAAGAAWMGRGRSRAVAAEAAAMTAVRVARVPGDPDDPAWAQASPATIQLFPQNMVVPRLKEAGAKQIDVRVLYDADRLALLVEWKDAHEDIHLGTVSEYRDGVAIQFPETPNEALPPFTMGVTGNGVVIYHWKSDWQFGPEYDVDEAYPNMYADWYAYSGKPAGEMPEATDYLTHGRKEYLTPAAVGNAVADPTVQKAVGPVQKMRAEGFGTIEPHATQDAQGKGQWQDGSWRIAISLPRRQQGFAFTEGTIYSLAFAAWDGSLHERNGQKGYSPWQTLELASRSASREPSDEKAAAAGAPANGTGSGTITAGLVLVAAATAALAGLVRRVRGSSPGRQDKSGRPEGD